MIYIIYVSLNKLVEKNKNKIKKDLSNLSFQHMCPFLDSDNSTECKFAWWCCIHNRKRLFQTKQQILNFQSTTV